MAELLRTNYKDAVFEGYRKFIEIVNPDNTKSFEDVTDYTVRDEAFFGAADANKINGAINAIITAMDNGTDLYAVFSEFFEEQKTFFYETANTEAYDFQTYLEQLTDKLNEDVNSMRQEQESEFNEWFEHIRGKLSEDAAGNLQNQIDKGIAHYASVDSRNYDAEKDAYVVNIPALDLVEGSRFSLVWNLTPGHNNDIYTNRIYINGAKGRLIQNFTDSARLLGETNGFIVEYYANKLHDLSDPEIKFWFRMTGVTFESIERYCARYIKTKNNFSEIGVIKENMEGGCVVDALVIKELIERIEALEGNNES